MESPYRPEPVINMTTASFSPIPPIEDTTRMIWGAWRTMLEFSKTDQAKGMAAIYEMQAKIDAVRSTLSPADAATYHAQTERVRADLQALYDRDPHALKGLLGIAPPARPARQSIGEMAVRTAIRATIWESIWTLFRAFR
jgi:hypothetical protein